MKTLENALDSYFKEIGLQDQLKMRKWLQKWPQTVGSHINRYTRPLVIKDGVLWVEVLDSNWLYHLTSLQERIISDFNSIAGYKIIKSLKLINAGSLDREREVIQKSLNNNKRDDIKAPPPQLALQEKNLLEKYIDPVPPLYKEKIRKFIYNIYLQQKKRIIEGADICPLCRLPYYLYEMRENLCYICYMDYEEWFTVLKKLFESKPWLCWGELEKGLAPSKDMFDYCKEKIRQEYFENIMTLSGGQYTAGEENEKILHKKLQHYILFKAEKDPSLIQREDIYKALKDFGGLFSKLFCDLP